MALLINEIKRQNDQLRDEIARAIERVLNRGWYILGPEVEAFEQEFAGYCGAEHCVSLANGTDALEFALRALNLPEGGDVVTVANAGMYSTIAILQAGLRPVFADVNPHLMTMSPAALRATLTARTRAIVVTHLYGQMAEIEELREIASTAGLPLIEDCAQAHGAVLQGRKAGTWGDIGCFSFYPTKNLGAIGDGGAVITQDPAIAQRIRHLRQYGWTSKYKSEIAGGRNSRLDELQAAVLRAKLPHLDRWNKRRRAIAARYTEALSDLNVVTPAGENPDYVAHLYVVRLKERDHLRSRLKDKGIATDVHYPIPDHRQTSVAERLDSIPELPVTEQCCAEVVSLPCFPEMLDSEVNSVIDAVYAAAGAAAAVR